MKLSKLNKKHKSVNAKGGTIVKGGTKPTFSKAKGGTIVPGGTTPTFSKPKGSTGLFEKGGKIKDLTSLSRVVSEIPGNKDYPTRSLIAGITKDGEILVMEINNGIRHGNKKTYFSSSAIQPFTLSAAKKYSKQYWVEYFEQEPDQITEMNERMGTKFRSPSAAAQYVLDNDGVLHGFDYYSGFGDVTPNNEWEASVLINGTEYLFLYQAGGQLRKYYNDLSVKYISDELLNKFLSAWDSYHLKETPANYMIPVVEQDKLAILTDAVSRIKKNQFEEGGVAEGKPKGSTGLFDNGGEVIKYKTVNGTSYHDTTPQQVVDVLENSRKNKTRIVLDYGDVNTGKSWGERDDIKGYIGRSTGDIKTPILINNARSIGGGGILDHCIVKISESKGGKVLYQHAGYKPADSFESGGQVKKDYDDESKYDDYIYAHEIELYAENNKDLYRQRYVPIMKNLRKKLDKGVFDVDKAAVLWKYWVEDADKRYQKEVLGDTPKGYILSVNDRKLLAKKQAAFTQEEYGANKLEGYEHGGSVGSDRVDDVLTNYMVTALWSSSDGDEHLDENHSIHDIAEKTKSDMRRDVEKFLLENDADIKEAGLTDDQVGHSFWLSRNRHGAGFFDYGTEAADRLQEAAMKFGGIDLEVGDDNQVHAMQSYAHGGKTAKGHTSPDRITNQEANVYSENRIPFRGNNLEGKILDNGDYVVLSFGHYPVWYWCGKNSQWYGNSDKYSVSTAKHITQSRPDWNATMIPMAQLLDVMKQDREAHYDLGGLMIRSDMHMAPDNTLGAHAGSAILSQNIQ